MWFTGRSIDPLFPARTGGHLSRDAVADLLAKHVKTVAKVCPILVEKTVTPHTLRHVEQSPGGETCSFPATRSHNPACG